MFFLFPNFLAHPLGFWFDCETRNLEQKRLSIRDDEVWDKLNKFESLKRIYW